MISIRCECGKTLAHKENEPPNQFPCPKCGRAVRIACAEVPLATGDADFDATLVQREGPPPQPAPGRPATTIIALGGCAEISIGRLAGSTIELPSQNVSRQHARLVRLDFGPSRWKIVDAGSRGGVCVNGQRITEHELKPGDTIVIAEYKFEYKATWAAAPAGAPTPPVVAPPPMPRPGMPTRPMPPIRVPEQGFWTRRKLITTLASAGVAILFVVVAVVLIMRGVRSSLDKMEAGLFGMEDIPGRTSMTLAEARGKYTTKLAQRIQGDDPLGDPPPNIFRIVKYDAPPGKLAAYLTPDPLDGARHSAIIWITGGDCNTIGDVVWEDAAPADDQTAAAYRKTGIVMMFPSLRGGNGNPGYKEGFYGEVDDILAAREFLARQTYVDPARIYLGGHSSGGTMVLLVAECSDKFRAVFSFGPVGSVREYGQQLELPFDHRQDREMILRSPALWLHAIKTPTFVFEGGRESNAPSVRSMARISRSGNVQFFIVTSMDHFEVLYPTNKVIAAKIKQDTGATTNLAFSSDDVPGLSRIK